MTNEKSNLMTRARDVLSESMGQSVSENDVAGLVRICEILQTCDSGAYTRYAVTRDEKRKVYYYNGNDRFTDSFQKPSDISKRKLRLKNPEDNEFMI